MNPFKALARLFEPDEQKRDRIQEELKDLKAHAHKVTPKFSTQLPSEAYLAVWARIGKLEKKLSKLNAKIRRSSEAAGGEHPTT